MPDQGMLFLIGLSGSGKSTVGRLLAERLQVPFFDADEEIERREGRRISEIFAADGEPTFREIERQVIGALCNLASGVVATGGGAPILEENRRAMQRSGRVVWIDAKTDTLIERVGRAGNPARPLLADGPAGALERLRAQRAVYYSDNAIRIDTEGKSPAEVAEAVLAQFETPQPIWVKTSVRTYPVVVGPEVLARAGALIREQGLDAHLRIVADERVAAMHGDALRASLEGLQHSWYLVPAGEEHKTVDQANHLYDMLLADRPERRDVIVAFGGGVVGDLAGFVAATLLRGVRFVQIPTTVLSQVDSSVGGKVGVDHPRGKNLIGAFHQPSLVLADVRLLRTLPPREIAAGWAEVVKIAVIQDADLFDDLEAHADELRALEPTVATRAIRRAIELKAQVVEQDELDLTGVRAILNYGHTLGHALEAATQYGTLLHGEGVAIGMGAAAHLAVELELHPAAAAERQDALLRCLGLPATEPTAEPAAVREAVGLDKKRDKGRISWILPNELGRVTTSTEVPEALVEAAILRVCGRSAQ